MNIIVILLILVIFGVLLNLSTRLFFLQRKRIYLFLGGYLVILLIAAIVHYTVIAKEMPTVEAVDEEVINIERLVENKEALEELAPYIESEVSFDVDQDELRIYSGDPDYMHLSVLIERTENDEQINVVSYQTPVFIQGIEITDQIENISVDFFEDELFLNAGHVYVDLYLTKNNFPIRQFTGEKIFSDHSSLFFSPSHLVHVQVPEKINLKIDNEVNVYYVN